MKTYEEMAQSALVRGKAIRKQRNKTNKILLGAVSGLAVCCLVILLAFSIEEQEPNPSPTDGSLNYGQASYLLPDHKISYANTGKGFQYIAGTQNPGAGSKPNAAPPRFEFQHGYIHVVAKAIEEVGIYETLNEYGSIRTQSYRMFAMQVIDPLESGMETDIEGIFFYLLPAHLQGDLTQYDALLISMTQLPKNFVLRGGDSLIADDYIFADPQDCPELGNIIAFTDGVFDESMWQDRSWLYGYQFAKHYLDKNDDMLLVSRGSTLEDALQRRQAQIQEWGEWGKCATVNHYNFQTEAAQQAMAYVKPFENGVFVPQRSGLIRRYINGCPTNEWIRINLEDETVTTSDYRFEDEDFENLPDLSSYIASLDLTQIAPQHTDPSGKILIFNSAVGWYEKTENGVYAIVRIAWRYFAEDDYYMEYYDETFILLDETGDHIISREDLINLIGDNQNISYEEYGVGIPMPMC